MRPYLAIIKDSFREAFASYVLWATLVVITLFLLVLLPIHFDVDQATEFRDGEISNWDRLLTDLRDAAEGGDESPGGHIWSMLTEDQQKLVDDYLDGNSGDEPGPPGGRRMRQQRRFLGGLNKLLGNAELYDEAAFADVEVSEEILHAVRNSKDGSDELKAAQRELIAATFPRSFDLFSDGAVYVGYLIWKHDSPLPVAPSELNGLIRSGLAISVSLIFGWGGILVSILVTSNIIPRTFEPGEIVLLLSKPISRPLLFVSRFIGGCAFTFVNVAYLLVGLWLIAGMRFGIWNHRLLLGIPVYVFLFAVYFSVSAFIGLRFRNAIIAVGFTIVFSFFLWALSFTKGIFDQVVLAPIRITTIVPAGDEVLVTNSSKETLIWQQQNWKPVFNESGQQGPQFQRRILFADSHFHPQYDAGNDRIVAMKPGTGWSSNDVIAGTRASNWERTELGRTPDSILALFVDGKGRVICVGMSGIYDFVPPDPEEQKNLEILEAASGGFWKPPSRTGTKSLHAEGFARVRREDSIAMNPATSALSIYRGGTLTNYPQLEDGTYGAGETVALQHANTESDARQAVVAAGNTVLVGYEDGIVELVGGESREFDTLEGDTIKSSETSSNGRFVAFLTHEGRVWLFDCEAKQPLSIRIPAQGNVSAIAFRGENELLIADRYTRVRAIDVEDGHVLEQFAPSDSMIMKAYFWVVKPLHLVLPKPSELNTVVTTLMTEKESEVLTAGQQADANLQQERISVDTWTPVWTSLAFTLFMIGLSCWYISSRDF
ncbi:MAG: ABC transporter permease subunit [Planctomycetaceae bacterium]|nr:ABC transporter permease subunit [Planctomycetaceae bacterium]